MVLGMATPRWVPVAAGRPACRRRLDPGGRETELVAQQDMGTGDMELVSRVGRGSTPRWHWPGSAARTSEWGRGGSGARPAGP